jgi:hypothetical protein
LVYVALVFQESTLVLCELRLHRIFIIIFTLYLQAKQCDDWKCGSLVPDFVRFLCFVLLFACPSYLSFGNTSFKMSEFESFLHDLESLGKSENEDLYDNTTEFWIGAVEDDFMHPNNNRNIRSASPDVTSTPFVLDQAPKPILADSSALNMTSSAFSSVATSTVQHNVATPSQDNKKSVIQKIFNLSSKCSTSKLNVKSSKKKKPLQQHENHQQEILLLEHDIYISTNVEQLTKSLKKDEFLDVLLLFTMKSHKDTPSKGHTDVVSTSYYVVETTGVRVDPCESAGFTRIGQILQLSLQISAQCKEVVLGCRFFRPGSCTDDKFPTSTWRSIDICCGLIVPTRTKLSFLLAQGSYHLINRISTNNSNKAKTVTRPYGPKRKRARFA